MSRNIFVSCFFIVPLVLVVPLSAAAQDPPAPVVSAEGAEARSKIEAALDELISVEFEETSLRDVVLYLEDLHNIQIEIDHQTLRDVGLGAETPITFAVTDISTRAVLRQLLREIDLTWIIRNDGLLITTPEEAEDNLVITIYDVHDLVAFINDFGEEECDIDSLIRLITVTIELTSWDEVGGPSSIGGYQATGLDVLVISQTDSIHYEIEQLLAALRRVRDVEEGASDPSLTVTDAAGAEARLKIEAALDESITVEFIETSLAEVCDHLSNVCNIPIRIDSQSLRDVGLDSDVTITRNLSCISTRAMLRLLLGELDLTWSIRDEVLLITTPEKAEDDLITKVYDIRDLVDFSHEDGEEGHEQDSQMYLNCDDLIELITSVVEPTSWDEIGGPGSCSEYQAAGLNVLVISQSDRIHRDVEQLLTTLRRLRDDEATGEASEPSVAPIGRAGCEARLKIEAALDEPISVDFTRRGLDQVCVFVSGVSGIPILLDAQSLEDVGLDAEIPITFTATNMPAREVLEEILRELDLTWIIRNEVLVIIATDSGCPIIFTKLYCVQDLVTFAEEDGDKVVDFDSLIQVIASAIEPSSWDKIGGSGLVREFQSPGLSVLVISQTEPIHREVELFLTTLRSVRKDGALEEGPRLAPIETYWLSEPFGAGPFRTGSPVGPGGFRPANDANDE